MRRALCVVLALFAGACSNGVGDRCALNQPCPADLVCNTPPGDGGVGVCDYPPRQYGQPCSSAAECAEELTCANHFTPGVRHGTCVHRREDGEPCYVDRDCVSDRCVDAVCVAPQG